MILVSGAANTHRSIEFSFSLRRNLGRFSPLFECLCVLPVFAGGGGSDSAEDVKLTLNNVKNDNYKERNHSQLDSDRSMRDTSPVSDRSNMDYKHSTPHTHHLTRGGPDVSDIKQPFDIPRNHLFSSVLGARNRSKSVARSIGKSDFHSRSVEPCFIAIVCIMI